MPPWGPSSRVPPPPPQRITWRNLEAGDMLLYVQALVALYRDTLLERDEVRDALKELGLVQEHAASQTAVSTAEVCDRCDIVLNNVTTGIVWVQLPDSLPNQNRFRLCAACAEIVKTEQGATEIMRAKGVQG